MLSVLKQADDIFAAMTYTVLTAQGGRGAGVKWGSSWFGGAETRAFGWCWQGRCPRHITNRKDVRFDNPPVGTLEWNALGGAPRHDNTIPRVPSVDGTMGRSAETQWSRESCLRFSCIRGRGRCIERSKGWLERRRSKTSRESSTRNSQWMDPRSSRATPPFSAAVTAQLCVCARRIENSRTRPKCSNSPSPLALPRPVTLAIRLCPGATASVFIPNLWYR